VAFISTSLNWRLWTYCLASAVSAGGFGGLRRSRYSSNAQAPRPSATTITPTITEIGTESRAVSIWTAVFAFLASLSSANRHLPDEKRGSGGRAAKLEVRSDGFHIHQHLIQISGDGDFRYRKGQFSVTNPQADSAARIVAGHDIHTRADEF